MQQARFLVSVAVLASALCAAPQKHPHFDDAGTLVWSTNFDAAKAAAKQADKLIFVEYGRKA